MRHALEFLASRLGSMASIALAIPLLTGLAFGRWLPRGPATAAEALSIMVLALLVGLVSGALANRRWAILGVPAVFAMGVEVARWGVVGPTVDRIHLVSTYGVIAFVVGRGVQAILVLAPMALGATYGVAAARARAGRAGGALGWLATGLATLALVGVAYAVGRPASTAAIVGADGAPLPGSIAELVTVELGGQHQTLMVRGRSVDAPVLLYLAGGPGGTDLGAMRADAGLEQRFIVVTWEQRGAGKSYGALEPAETLTLERMVADTLELTEVLLRRFDEEKLFLVGNSWGTLLGALAVRERPELFHALVGAGQMVSPRETDVTFYADTLAWAEVTGREGLVATLRGHGPPPYGDLLAYEPALSHEHDWNPYPWLDVGKEMPANLMVTENTLLDRVNGLRGFLDVFAVLYPQLQELDLRRDAPRLEVPVVVVTGRYEARGRRDLARAWFDELEATAKRWVEFERSGHRPHFEEPAAFARLMGDLAEELEGRR